MPAPRLLSRVVVLNALLDSYKARIEELERINRSLLAGYDERGDEIQRLMRVKD